jgi:hypothetical protein
MQESIGCLMLRSPDTRLAFERPIPDPSDRSEVRGEDAVRRSGEDHSGAFYPVKSNHGTRLFKPSLGWGQERGHHKREKRFMALCHQLAGCVGIQVYIKNVNMIIYDFYLPYH